MAAAFVQQRLPAIDTTMTFPKQQPPQQHRQQQPSPPQPYPNGQYVASNIMGGTPPSANVSPTNLYSHLHVKQLRQPRQPLYVPAALRPTDLSSRPKDVPCPRAPDTPPDSKHGSFDSARSRGGSDEFDVQSIDDMDDLHVLRGRLSRSASDELDDLETIVTGLPSTAHWKPNESRPDCAVCHESFTWFFRRHHCRRCGEVVCGDHSANVVPLDQNARYNSQGSPSRACDPCFRDWKLIKRLRHSRASSLADSMSTARAVKSSLPIPPRGHGQELEPEFRVGSMARSEGGMVWSTF